MIWPQPNAILHHAIGQTPFLLTFVFSSSHPSIPMRPSPQIGFVHIGRSDPVPLVRILGQRRPSIPGTPPRSLIASH